MRQKPTLGFEPRTYALRKHCSTTELSRQQKQVVASTGLHLAFALTSARTVCECSAIGAVTKAARTILATWGRAENPNDRKRAYTVNIVWRRGKWSSGAWLVLGGGLGGRAGGAGAVATLGLHEHVQRVSG